MFKFFLISHNKLIPRLPGEQSLPSSDAEGQGYADPSLQPVCRTLLSRPDFKGLVQPKIFFLSSTQFQRYDTIARDIDANIIIDYP